MAGSRKKHRADPPGQLAAALRTTLTARLAAGSLLSGGGWRVVLALSGGRDSVGLLRAAVAVREDWGRLGGEAAAHAPLELSAVHVHHGLSAQADAWADFCVALCQRWQIALTVRRVQVLPQAGQGLEAAARAARYAVFSELSADVLLLAHHREDQAATVLFRLLRGCGVAGAAGMARERWLPRPAPSSHPEQPGPRLLRPWLGLARSALEAYLASLEQDWVEDDSNTDSRFSRNYLRHAVWPVLQAHFPAAEAALARAADCFAEAQTLLNERAEEDWAAALARRAPGQANPPDGRRLPLAALRELSPERGRNLLRYVLRQAGLPAPAAVTLEEWRQQLQHAAGERAGELRVSLGASQEGRAFQLHAWRGELWIETAQPVGAAACSGPATALWLEALQEPWQVGDCRQWSCSDGFLRARAVVGAGLSLPALQELAADDLHWSCRDALPVARLSGLRLRTAANRPSRPLKDHWQEQAVPPWRRGRLPLLLLGEQVLWAAGIGGTSELCCSPEGLGLLLEWEALGAYR